MRINAEIIEALRNATEKAGSQTELAERAGIAQGVLSRIRHGKTHWVTDDMWDRLHPHLREFLPPDHFSQADKMVGERFADWPSAPPPPQVSPEALAVAELFDLLPSEDQQRLRHEAEQAALRRFRESRKTGS